MCHWQGLQLPSPQQPDLLLHQRQLDVNPRAVADAGHEVGLSDDAADD